MTSLPLQSDCLSKKKAAQPTCHERGEARRCTRMQPPNEGGRCRRTGFTVTRRCVYERDDCLSRTRPDRSDEPVGSTRVVRRVNGNCALAIDRRCRRSSPSSIGHALSCDRRPTTDDRRRVILPRGCWRSLDCAPVLVNGTKSVAHLEPKIPPSNL